MREIVVRPISTQTTADAAPRLRWPSERALTPTHCAYCAARLLVTEYPPAECRLRIVEIACLDCARVACELISDHAPVPMTPTQWRALPTDQGKRGRPRRHARGDDSLPNRALALLRRWRTLHGEALAATLGCSVPVVRNAVTELRHRGYAITWAQGNGCYTLVEGDAP